MGVKTQDASSLFMKSLKYYCCFRALKTIKWDLGFYDSEDLNTNFIYIM